MILRVRWLLLTNNWLIELGGPWPGPDGKPATAEAKDPKTGEVIKDPQTGKPKMFLLPATVGAIFFVKEESEAYPDEHEDDKQVGFGERAFYEIWAEPTNENAAEVLGGKIWSKGACTRRLRVPENSVFIHEEEWPLHSAYKLGLQRSDEIKSDYEEIDRLPMPAAKPDGNSKSEEAPAQTS